MSRIILLNGASSAGKTTIAKELQIQMPEPFWHVSSDQFVEAGFLPSRYWADRAYWISTMRPRFFEAFHRCISAMADAGNDLIVDHVVEFDCWLSELVDLLKEHDVFYVGVHCSLPVLEERERTRGNRTIGEARDHLEVVHSFSDYDCEVQSDELSPGECAEAIIQAWQSRRSPSVFKRLARESLRIREQ